MAGNLHIDDQGVKQGIEVLTLQPVEAHRPHCGTDSRDEHEGSGQNPRNPNRPVAGHVNAA